MFRSVRHLNNQKHLKNPFRDLSLKDVSKWMSQDRFKFTKRHYAPEKILPLMSRFGGTYGSDNMAKKLYWNLRRHQKNKTSSNTFGIMDPVQCIQAVPYLDSIYVSGWVCSSTASIDNNPSPDLASYPYTTVPNKVEQLYKALDFHDRKQRIMKTQGKIKELVDYGIPIIADGDTGFSGVDSTMRLIKLMIEKGAAGVHLEDQLTSAKKCGHLGGKVLVPVQEHIDRLIAARLQADIMNHNLVLIARTDAESGSLLSSNIDVRDQPFILGEFKSSHRALGKEICTFLEGIQKLHQHENIRYSPNYYTGNINENMMKAKSILKTSFDWEPSRTKEGFYRVKSGVDYCIHRGLSYSPYSDMLWMETSIPDYNVAKQFSTAIKEKYDHIMLGYNLSPSFNWDSIKITDTQLKDFSHELAKLGFCWQFITLAGFHVNGLAMTRFAKNYKKDNMLAYVRDIQRAERNENVSLLKHQSWSGVDYTDYCLNLINPETTTKASTSLCTEKQFDKI